MRLPKRLPWGCSTGSAAWDRAGGSVLLAILLTPTRAVRIGGTYKLMGFLTDTILGSLARPSWSVYRNSNLRAFTAHAVPALLKFGI